VEGYLLLDKAKFPASFASDVSPEEAAFMADSQAVGCERAARRHQRTSMEVEAQLVPAHDRG
jgi:hypothetical protein